MFTNYFDVKIVARGSLSHGMNGMNKNDFFSKTRRIAPKTGRNRLVLTLIVFLQSLVALAHPERPLETWFHILGYSGISIRYGNGTKSLVGVLGVLGPPNFAGILLGSIPNDSDLFWGNPTSFRKMLIFVHSVHSMTRGASGDYFDVKIVSEHIPLHRETISSTLKMTVSKCLKNRIIWFHILGYSGVSFLIRNEIGRAHV